MIGEVLPILYDVSGRAVTPAASKTHRQFFHRTFPMGRDVSQPLANQCSSFSELRRFLTGCKYVPDREQFNRPDYWLPPDEFERLRRGDCEDFALWTWRQLLGMGYRARYVVGRAGRYGNAHAWVTIEVHGHYFVVESLAAHLGEWMPRLRLVRYEPVGSVEWDGARLHYFIHTRPEGTLPALMLVPLAAEWLWFWVRVLPRLLMALLRVVRRRAKRGLA